MRRLFLVLLTVACANVALSGQRQCPPGWGLEASVTVANQRSEHCRPCSTGFYSHHSRHHSRPCLPCSRCGDGLYVEKLCRRTHDTRCGSCTATKGLLTTDFWRKCTETDAKGSKHKLKVKVKVDGHKLKLKVKTKNKNGGWLDHVVKPTIQVASDDHWPKGSRIEDALRTTTPANVALKLFYNEMERQRHENSRVADDGQKRHEFWRWENDKKPLGAEIELKPSYHSYSTDTRRHHSMLLISTSCIILAIALILLASLMYGWKRRGDTSSSQWLQHKLYLQLSPQENQMVNECAERVAAAKRRQQRKSRHVTEVPIDEYYWEDDFEEEQDDRMPRVRDNPLVFDDDGAFVPPYVHRLTDKQRLV